MSRKPVVAFFVSFASVNAWSALATVCFCDKWWSYVFFSFASGPGGLIIDATRGYERIVTGLTILTAFVSVSLVSLGCALLWKHKMLLAVVSLLWVLTGVICTWATGIAQ
jgi:hypothetical protein